MLFGAAAGVAGGGSFAAMTGLSAAVTSGHPAAAGPMAHGGWRAFGAPGRPGHAVDGTIISVNGTTLTLRTENGDVVVDTTSSTVSVKEQQRISVSSLVVGDEVRVLPAGPPPPPGSSSGSSGTSGSGSSSSSTTVTARRIVVVEPTFVGRVSSVSGNTITLVGRYGQLLTVTTTSATRYDQGRSTASSSSVTDGVRIAAEGTRTSLSSLQAQLVVVLPKPPSPPAAPPVTPPSKPPVPAASPATGSGQSGSNSSS